MPLRPFRELAFALSVGILIDAFVVRSLLAPALLTVMESWNGSPIRQTDDDAPPAVAEPSVTEPSVAEPEEVRQPGDLHDAQDGRTRVLDADRS